MVSGAKVSQGSGRQRAAETRVFPQERQMERRLSSGANTSAINGAKKYKFSENDSNTLPFSAALNQQNQ